MHTVTDHGVIIYDTDDTIDLSNYRLTVCPNFSDFRRLKTLFCGDVTALSGLPAGLRELYGNRLTSLPAKLPEDLEILSCEYSDLTALPTLPAKLRELYCRDTGIRSLPELPASLEVLSCGNNEELQSLPELPASLEVLSCNDTAIRSLPELPENLRELNVSGSDLTALPTLPASLQELICNDTELYFLPELPASLDYIQYDGTPIYDVLNTDDIEIINDKLQKIKSLRKTLRNSIHDVEEINTIYNTLIRTNIPDHIVRYILEHKGKITDVHVRNKQRKHGGRRQTKKRQTKKRQTKKRQTKKRHH